MSDFNASKFENSLNFHVSDKYCNTKSVGFGINHRAHYDFIQVLNEVWIRRM